MQVYRNARIGDDLEGLNTIANAKQLVVVNLTRWIIDGTLLVGAEMNQQEIASQLGVSRSPVRDALQQLKETGLISIKHNNRAVVTKLNFKGIHEIFEIRAALASLAAFHATKKLTCDGFLELETLCERMLNASSFDDYLIKHNAFHDLIAERSEMPRLRQHLATLRTLITPYMHIYSAQSYSHELKNERHDDLVNILRSRNPEKVASAFAKHIRGSYEQLSCAAIKARDKSSEFNGQLNKEIHK